MYRILLIDCTPEFVHSFADHYREYVVVDAPMTFDEEPACRKEIDAVIVGGGMDSFLRYRVYLNEKVPGIPVFICTPKWKEREVKDAFAYGVWDYFTDEEFFTRRDQVLASLSKIIVQKKLSESWKIERTLLNGVIECNTYPISIWNSEGYLVRGNGAHLGLFKVQPHRDNPVFDSGADFSDSQKEAMRRGLKEKNRGKGFNIFLDPYFWKKDGPKYAERWKKGERVSFLPVWINMSQFIPGQPEHLICIKGECFSIRNEDGEIEYYVAVHEDITPRIKAEEKRKKKLEKMKEAGIEPEIPPEKLPARPSGAVRGKKPSGAADAKESEDAKKRKAPAPGLTIPEVHKKAEAQHRKSSKKK